MSIMIGGEEYGYQAMKDLWMTISAKVDGEPCAAYVGPRGSGHFVKTVHNGIEYAILELIAETYDIMRNGMKLEIFEIRDVFREWVKSRLESYLLQITIDVLEKIDAETGLPIVELISDKAEQKGTGRWASQTALELDVPAPCIHAALTSRIISTYKEARIHLSRKLREMKSRKDVKIAESLLPCLRDSFYLTMILSYIQGLHLINKASRELSYNIDLLKLLKIWRGGCIISSKLIYELIEVVGRNPGVDNLLLDAELFKEVTGLENSLRILLSNLKSTDIPTPVLDSALNYLIALRREKLPANILQALRDRFGYHGFERIDKPGRFHLE